MKVNGKQITLSGPVSLETFLKEEGYLFEKIAVERNGRIVPKAQYQQTILEADDTLEVVSFVGGG